VRKKKRSLGSSFFSDTPAPRNNLIAEDAAGP
jgi:hypothetical protein